MSSTSVSMTEIHPLPKIQKPRIRSGRGGKSTIFTSTPEKDKLIAAMEEKEQKVEEAIKRKKAQEERKKKKAEEIEKKKGMPKKKCERPRKNVGTPTNKIPRKQLGRKAKNDVAPKARANQTVPVDDEIDSIFCPGCDEIYVDPPVSFQILFS